MEDITRYGSTLYIGIAMVFVFLTTLLRLFFQFCPLFSSYFQQKTHKTFIHLQYKHLPLNSHYEYLPPMLGSDSRSLSVVDARLSPLDGELGVDIIYKLQAAQRFRVNFSAYSPIIPVLFRILYALVIPFFTPA